MKIINDIDSIQMPCECTATIGVFDGVHRGHQHLITMMMAEARRKGTASMVITFDRQPREVFDATYQPQVLSTLDEKRAYVSQLDVDYLVVLPFTRALASLTAQEFMQQILREKLNVTTLVTGYDNRFGKNRTEGFDDYVVYGRELGMEVLRGDAEMMTDGSCAVSSSVIRQLLTEGRVEQMPACMGRYYQLSGTVMPGEHIGSTLGFPTANLEPGNPHKLIPASGVYAVWASIGDAPKKAAMMNIGTRPTFKGHHTTLEVNIFNFEGDIYGQTVTIDFVARLREERRFDSPEALVKQLEEDKKQVEQILNQTK
ncbi:bifunctional riboflavin kinase/FAD synthetase [Prevotella sp. P6B1]|uniref:bifunctional riboflavin kinase/FAD synthetase n=1 Tax=Prevotella sp. P6B1 TaxID=1410613 RepID=UPI00051AF918|nr:bifunctional riboflavin kinase/FAD synthetase [Prevotella sp. P6B1]